jgi:hypothetical protein
MPFIHRENGAVKGLWAQFQEGYAEEELAEDDAEVVAFLNPSHPVVSVSARQFKLQLLAAGFLDQVDAWVASQSKAVQIAYEYSGSFVRTEPMMAAGFTGLGFTDQQVDAFFEAAAQL